MLGSVPSPRRCRCHSAGAAACYLLTTDLRLTISLPSLLRSICQMPMRGVGATLSAHTLGTQAGGHVLPGAVSARGRLTRVRRIRACVRPVQIPPPQFRGSCQCVGSLVSYNSLSQAGGPVLPPWVKSLGLKSSGYEEFEDCVQIQEIFIPFLPPRVKFVP